MQPRFEAGPKFIQPVFFFLEPIEPPHCLDTCLPPDPWTVGDLLHIRRSKLLQLPVERIERCSGRL